MIRRLRAVIVGAGIGGLTAAQALRRANCDVQIVEQSPQFGEIGAGIVLSPNAVNVLRELGLGTQLMERSFQPNFHVFRDWKTGASLFRANIKGEYETRFHAPLLSVHRADLHEILRSNLPAAIFRLGSKCVGFKQVGETAVAMLDDGSELEADFIIGADGIKSSIREKMFGKDDPTFTGFVAWRFMLPADGTHKRKIEPAITNWLGRAGHVVHYYVRSGQLINIVAITETNKWTTKSWSLRGEKSELLELHVGWNAELVSLLENAETCFKWGLFDRPPLKKWTVDRVTLLGDAAHPMLPFLGQGAAMAMEDGLTLGLLLSQNRMPLDEILKHYERIRLPRTTRVQLGARERGRENHLRSPVARFVRNLKFSWRQLTNPHATLHNGEWIYSYRPRDAIETTAPSVP